MKHTIYITNVKLYRVVSENYVTHKSAVVFDGLGNFDEALAVANRFADNAVKPSPLYFQIESYTEAK